MYILIFILEIFTKRCEQSLTFFVTYLLCNSTVPPMIKSLCIKLLNSLTKAKELMHYLYVVVKMHKLQLIPSFCYISRSLYSLTTWQLKHMNQSASVGLLLWVVKGISWKLMPPFLLHKPEFMSQTTSYTSFLHKNPL